MKKFILLVLGLILCGSCLYAKETDTNKFIIYYFHGNQRCSNCIKIEKWSKETIEKEFVAKLKNKKIQYKVINIDEKANQSYVKKYNLYTKALVISEINNKNQEIKSKNLEKIWINLVDENKFKSYVSNELKGFMK